MNYWFLSRIILLFINFYRFQFSDLTLKLSLHFSEVVFNVINSYLTTNLLKSNSIFVDGTISARKEEIQNEKVRIYHTSKVSTIFGLKVSLN